MGRWILVLLIGLTLNLVVRTHQVVIDREGGSGDGGDDDDASGTDDKDEGSTDENPFLTTACRIEAARASRVPGAFSPQCTRDGEFEPMQCGRGRPRECWCVDKDGREKAGTKQQPTANRPNCADRTVVLAATRNPLGAIPGGDRMKTRPPVLSYSTLDVDDIVIEDASTPKPFTQEKTTERRPSKTHTTTTTVRDVDHSDDKSNVQKQSMLSFIFNDPLILAGIVGGAVLALLCIVLLVMFTIYRMRKKDEGSYALDEPKKSYGFAYTRARDQEFFA